MKKIIWLLIPLTGGLAGLPQTGLAQGIRDSVVYRIIYRDTVVYHYDTVRVRHYIHSDTLYTSTPTVATYVPAKKKGLNPQSWGIGPSLGAYYSPYHGFDINIGFGIQYYLFAVPSFRNPHMGHRKPKK